MARVDNSVVIDAPLDLVWDMTNDVESWPELFSEYESAEILERDEETIRFRLTLRPDEKGQVFSWVSERTPDPATHTVRAHRIETGPFNYMNLYWDYQVVDAGVLMHWVQDFEVRPGLPFGDEAMADRLNTNTRREMGIIKEKVERSWRQRVAATQGEPLRVLLSIDIHPGQQDEFEQLWWEHAQLVAGDPANLGQSLSVRTDSPASYVVVTDWADEPSFRAFERSDAQQKYLKRLWPLRESGSMTLLRMIPAMAVSQRT
jgi:aromatase